MTDKKTGAIHPLNLPPKKFKARAFGKGFKKSSGASEARVAIDVPKGRGEKQ